MTLVDLHPEELFDGLRAGSLPREARSRLLAHCAHCEPCQFELRLIEGRAWALPDEDAQAAQLAAAALRQLSWPPPAPALSRPARPRRLRQQLAAAAALLVLGFGFGAAAMFTNFPRALSTALDGLLRGERRMPTLRHVEPAQPRADAPPTSPPVERQVPRAAAAPASSEAPLMAAAESTTAPAVPGSEAAHGPRRAAAGSRTRHRAASSPLTAAARSPRPVTEADAEAALSLATQARSTGYEGEAVERYRHVIERFAHTRAAGAAHVALGRLLYTELAQPQAALPLFEAYLARGGAQELAEEAMYHRGMCLLALRRTEDAGASFRQLLERFPGSMYAAQARARLSHLPGP